MRFPCDLKNENPVTIDLRINKITVLQIFLSSVNIWGCINRNSPQIELGMMKKNVSVCYHLSVLETILCDFCTVVYCLSIGGFSRYFVVTVILTQQRF